MPRRKLAYEEITRREGERVAQGRQAEGLVRVPGVASRPGHVMMKRFRQEEIALVREAAKAQGIEVLQFVRGAVLGAPPAAEKADRGPDQRVSYIHTLEVNAWS